MIVQVSRYDDGSRRRKEGARGGKGRIAQREELIGYRDLQGWK